MARQTDIHGMIPIKYTLPAATASVGITAFPGQLAVSIKYASGGSLEIVNGSTPAPSGLGWLLGTTEIFNMDCAGKFYVCVTGATCVFQVVHGRSAGFQDV